MSQPLDSQVKEGGSTSGHLLWVTPCARAAERRTAKTQSRLPQRAPSKNNTDRTFSVGHTLAEDSAHSSFILAATPISQMRRLRRAARLEVTQEVGGSSHTQAACPGAVLRTPCFPHPLPSPLLHSSAGWPTSLPTTL